jgi:hypothetical protein
LRALLTLELLFFLRSVDTEASRFQIYIDFRICEAHDLYSQLLRMRL